MSQALRSRSSLVREAAIAKEEGSRRDELRADTTRENCCETTRRQAFSPASHLSPNPPAVSSKSHLRAFARYACGEICFHMHEYYTNSRYSKKIRIARASVRVRFGSDIESERIFSIYCGRGDNQSA